MRNYRFVLLLVALCLPVAAFAQPPAAPRPATPDVQVGQKDGFFTTSDGVKIHYLLQREVQTFQNVILPGKTHLTAIAAGAPPSQQYVDAIARFIDMYDASQK